MKFPSLSLKAIIAGVVTVVALMQLGLLLLGPFARAAVASVFDNTNSASASTQSFADYVHSQMGLLLLMSFAVSGFAYFAGTYLASRQAVCDRAANAVFVFIILTTAYWIFFANSSDRLLVGQAADTFVGLLATLGCLVAIRIEKRRS